MYYKNRADAGKQLSQLLKEYKDKDVVVYGLPRGGVVVAEEIAKFLGAPLDLIFAHKIGHPHHSEYAIAAISESGHLIGSFYELPFISETWLEKEKQNQLQEIKRKRKIYLKGKKDLPLKNKIAIIVDDGIATGLTMKVGIKELKDRHPEKIVVVVPISPRSTADSIKATVDDFVGIIVDDDKFLGSVGAYYQEFNQVEDEEVIAILDNQSKNPKGL